MADDPPADALVVLAHPLADSLCAHLAGVAAAALDAAGRRTRLVDLYASGFDPRLTGRERRAYYADRYESGMPPGLLRDFAGARTLVLVFPTWWFGPPAILKGFLDRALVPGVAFDHAPGFGPIRPRLDALRTVVAVTTLGSPWWADWLVMGRPVRRVLGRAMFRACAPRARLSYLAFYRAENPGPERVARFAARLRRRLARLRA